MQAWEHYTSAFYDETREASRRSAQAVLPLIASWIRPKSVVDVGCGAGAWLAEWKRFGVEDVLGIDGDWVDESMLGIPWGQFLRHDLAQPLQLGRQYDLVMSMEVAEHLAAESAENLVQTLTQLGPMVLFSAAIPGQGGRHHVNEQWPDYWCKRFASRGYVAIDCIRSRLWGDPSVQWWYAQNIMLFVRQEHLSMTPALQILQREMVHREPQHLVHPKRYEMLLRYYRETDGDCPSLCWRNGREYLVQGQIREARHCFLQGLRSQCNWRNPVYLAASLLPHRLFHGLRQFAALIRARPL